MSETRGKDITPRQRAPKTAQAKQNTKATKEAVKEAASKKVREEEVEAKKKACATFFSSSSVSSKQNITVEDDDGDSDGERARSSDLFSNVQSQNQQRLEVHPVDVSWLVQRE